ncbi:hypothetical protein ACFCYN_14235 [Gottfriedia sp. NPDC056225]|uniref:hypothetical protein n=1 Tax=Gottfriedia sp. NPDC056225 TaxID=3345751 RepID=UPI0035DBD9C2
MLRLVKPGININSLLFYEGGFTKPNKNKQYRSQFLIDETRFIYADVILTYPIRDQTRFVNLKYEYHFQDGTVIDKKNLKVELKEGISTVTISFRNGLDKFYRWKHGEYKVVMFLDEKKIAVKSFSIVEPKENFLDKVDMTPIRLFQSSIINLTEKENREYITQFPQLDTGGITCEIDFSYPTLEIDKRVIIEQLIYYSDGEVLAKEEHEKILIEGSNTSKFELNWGSGKKGRWASGKYRMGIFLNGKICGEREFEIINTNVVNFPTLTFNSLRFYNTNIDGVEKKNRIYKREFPRETASFIFWEIQFSMTTISKRRRIDFEFDYLKSDNTVIARGKSSINFERGWDNAWYTDGWGYNDMRKWEKGLYSVRIKIDGKIFGEGDFEIVD